MRNATRSIFLIQWCAWLLTPAMALGNWPEFRGPGGDGHAPEANLPAAIDESVVKWKTAIPGKAWSSPVVWDDQIWLTTASEDGTNLSVMCLDRESGKIVHDTTVLQVDDPPFCHPMNSYATPTPVIESGRVYVHFGSQLTACLDTDTAEVLWQRKDFKCDHYRGAASSPILYDGKLFIAFDGFDVQYVVALDKKTGETVWKKDREIDYGTDNHDRMKAYSTASVIEVQGQPQVVFPSAVATIAYDPADGRALWTVYHDGMNASARPLFNDGLVFITNGMGAMVAVKAGGTGDITGTHLKWSGRKGVAKKSSPLLVDGLLYMTSDDGVLSARDQQTGKVVWQERLGGSYAASPIYADGRIYCFSIEGKITAFRPGDTFTPIAETELGDGFMASPAVVDDQLILRSKSHVYLIES